MYVYDVYVCVYMYMIVYVCVCMCMYVNVCVYMYVYVCVCMCMMCIVYVCMCRYMRPGSKHRRAESERVQRKRLGRGHNPSQRLLSCTAGSLGPASRCELSHRHVAPQCTTSHQPIARYSHQINFPARNHEESTATTWPGRRAV